MALDQSALLELLEALKATDVGDRIREAAEPVRGRADALGLRLDIDLPAEPLYVDGDPERLAQVLDNLLRNAVSYTEHGRIAITARRGGEQARIAVHDTGAGLDKSECTAIFEPYYQTESGKRSGGLGLIVGARLRLLRGGLGLHVRSGVGGSLWCRCGSLGLRARQVGDGRRCDTGNGACSFVIASNHVLAGIVPPKMSP